MKAKCKYCFGCPYEDETMEEHQVYCRSKPRPLVRCETNRWGFEEINDEFTSGECVMIKGRGDNWYRGRFESDHIKRGRDWCAEYYVILDIGFTFYPRQGTIARRPERWEMECDKYPDELLIIAKKLEEKLTLAAWVAEPGSLALKTEKMVLLKKLREAILKVDGRPQATA